MSVSVAVPFVVLFFTFLVFGFEAEPGGKKCCGVGVEIGGGPCPWTWCFVFWKRFRVLVSMSIISSSSPSGKSLLHASVSCNMRIA